MNSTSPPIQNTKLDPYAARHNRDLETSQSSVTYDKIQEALNISGLDASVDQPRASLGPEQKRLNQKNLHHLFEASHQSREEVSKQYKVLKPINMVNRIGRKGPAPAVSKLAPKLTETGSKPLAKVGSKKALNRSRNP